MDPSTMEPKLFLRREHAERALTEVLTQHDQQQGRE
jgi:hypothetical protein